MGTYCEKHFCNSEKPNKLNPDWMSKLPDNTKFSSLTIPGTHNSCSFYGTVIARTQTWSITDQLLSGIRYFDIRLRLFENLLRLQHGITNQYAFFDEILLYFINFLKEHPKEIIFMAVQKEYKDYNTNKTIEELFNEYTKNYKDYIIEYDGKDIEIGLIRGKIFFINVFHGKVHLIKLYKVQNEFRVNFNGDIKIKKRLVKKMFNRAQTLINDGNIYLNYLSGVSDYGIITPKAVAYETNKEVFKYNGRLGIVLLDFPGEELISYLIQQNFKNENFKKSKTENLNYLNNQNLIDKISNYDNHIKNGDKIKIIHLNTLKYLAVEDKNNILFCSKEPFFFEIKKRKEDEIDFNDGSMIKLVSEKKEFVFEIRKHKINGNNSKEILNDDIISLGIFTDKGEEQFLMSDYNLIDSNTKIQKVEMSQDEFISDADQWIIKKNIL